MNILMCPPTFYAIEYEINPWMNVNQKANHALAVKQWQTLYETIQAVGGTVHLMEPIKHVPDLVFTANAGLLYHDQIILSHFKYPERQKEMPYFKAWFNEVGFHIINTIQATTPYFEGEGDALFAGDQLFVGYGFRSERHFYETEPYFTQQNLVYCELSDPYFYHLDTCFCPINKHTAIWYPSAFSTASQIEMAKHIELIAVTEEEAKRFACNALVIDQDIILPSKCPAISTQLQQRGFNTHPCDMSEYLKAGGACKCLTLKLNQ